GQLLSKGLTHVASSCEDATDRGFQLLGNTLFGQVASGAGFERTPSVLLFGMHAQKKNGKLWPQPLQIDQDVQPAFSGHTNVEYDDIPVTATHELQGFESRPCLPKANLGKDLANGLLEPPA